jgi:hypothetical protein
MPAGLRSSADVFGIWHPTKVMDRVIGDPEDQRGTDVLDDRDRPDFPPSESDPRAARGWRQSPTYPPHGNRDKAVAHGGPSQGEQGWDDTPEEPGAAYTRADYGSPSDVPVGDAYQQEFKSPQSPTDAEGDLSIHEALTHIEDEERSSARSDGNGAGIPLNWDDE